MRSEKKKRLEAKGWRTGSAGEFLGLSEQEEVYIEMRLRLADGLKRRRLQRHVSQSELARAVHSSQSRIAKMEAGGVNGSPPTLAKEKARSDLVRPERACIPGVASLTGRRAHRRTCVRR